MATKEGSYINAFCRRYIPHLPHLNASRFLPSPTTQRNPLANILSNCKAYMMKPENAKTRDWVGAIKAHLGEEKGNFLVIPECKRSEPNVGALRKRYAVDKLAKEFKAGGAVALSVNSDGIMFGGSLEDITTAKEACPSLPILASDLVLYPYQLYMLRMAGADAVNLVAAACSAKDLLYLGKIAKSIGLGVCVTVNSKVQVENIAKVGIGVDAVLVSNREWEDFTIDQTGGRALEVLRSQEMKDFIGKLPETVVLIEGGVGGVGGDGYLEEAKKECAVGGILGSLLVEGGGVKLEDGGIRL